MNVPKLRFKEFNDEWSLTNIRNISSLVTKGTTPRKYEDKGINFVKVENIHDNTISNISSYISEDTHNKELKRSILKENDILFSIAGALGRTAIVKNNNLPANTNQANAIIRIDNLDNMDLYYLLNRLNHSDITNYINKCQSVGAQPNLSLEQVNNINVSLPSKKEQIKIGKLLELLDRKIELQSKKIEDLKLFKLYITNQLLSSNIIDKVPISNLGEIVTGTTPSKEKSEYWENGNILWVTPSDINEKRDINNSNSKLTEAGLKKGKFIPKDSILVTCIASIGKNAVIKNDGSCNQQINAIIPNSNYNCNYVYYLINNISKYMQSIAGTSATSIINKEQFSNLFVSVHNKAYQDKIDSILSSFEKKIELELSKLNKIQNIKKGLMQSMFV